MRFALATVALAGAALAHGHEEEAQSTVYSTEYYTITSCAPEVPDCPASSTVVTSSVVEMTTSTVYSTTTKTITDCPDTVSNCPADSTTVVTETVAVSTTVCPVEPTETPEVPEPTETPGSPEETETESPETPEETETPEVPEPTGSVIPPPAVSSTLVTEAPACPTTSVKTIKTSITTVIPTIIYETVEVPCETETPPAQSTPSSVPTGTRPGGPVETAGAATFGASALFAAAAGLFALMA
ncbi:uncharacterized protein B0H64DRAFT_374114 [Chaetomium fimeti]|jgi:hypothetical protein|uniref:GPI anchored serine-rich protein n=1 Tax=Chaetomium fimeti TaxID=1854472 RepID=A0AAE0HGB1_9PEZI|nr:hypothetical protein B0H64DRAFT_374114 [Chaetomium fimeti]